MLGVLSLVVRAIIFLLGSFAAHPLDVGDVFVTTGQPLVLANRAVRGSNAALHVPLDHALEGSPLLERRRPAPCVGAVDGALEVPQRRVSTALLESKQQVQ